MMNPRLAIVARRFQKKVMMLEAQFKAFRRQSLRYKRMVAGTDYDRQLIVRQERRVVRSHKDVRRRTMCRNSSSGCDEYLTGEMLRLLYHKTPEVKRRLKVFEVRIQS